MLKFDPWLCRPSSGDIGYRSELTQLRFADWCFGGNFLRPSTCLLQIPSYKWLDQELTTGPPFEFLAEMAVICPCRPNFESRDFFQHSVTVCLRNLDGSYLACISSEMSLNFVVWLAALQGIHQIRLGFVGLCHSF